MTLSTHVGQLWDKLPDVEGIGVCARAQQLVVEELGTVGIFQSWSWCSQCRAAATDGCVSFPCSPGAGPGWPSPAKALHLGLLADKKLCCSFIIAGLVEVCVEALSRRAWSNTDLLVKKIKIYQKEFYSFMSQFSRDALGVPLLTELFLPIPFFRIERVRWKRNN